MSEARKDLMDRVFLSTESIFEDVKKAKNSNKPVILVMGCDDYRSTVARLIANTPGIAEVHSVLDTKSFRVAEHGTKAGSLRRVRKWVSAKNIRRLYGYKMSIVWAFSTATLSGQSTMTFADQIGIVDTMFDAREKKSVIAVMQGSEVGLDVMRRNFPSVIQGYDQSSYLSRASPMPSLIREAKPFTIAVQVDNQIASLPTAWSSENVLLFGRTGSGKSTVARMLTQGNLEDSSVFVSGSGARSVTLDVTREEGRGWRVTDTPGFGEARTGAVSTPEATKKLKTFMSNIGGLYAHYVYVVRYNRIDHLDERLWKFFVDLSSNARDNLSVVVTCCEKGLEKNEEDDIRKRFKESKSFSWVSFKTLSEEYKTERMIAITKKRTEESLERLEKELADTQRTEAEFCRFNVSQDVLDNYKARGSKRLVSIVGNNNRVKNMYHAINDYLVQPSRQLVSLATGGDMIDANFILLPE